MDFLVDGGRRRHPQKKTAVYTGGNGGFQLDVFILMLGGTVG
jgi:hypothetical protein